MARPTRSLGPQNPISSNAHPSPPRFRVLRCWGLPRRFPSPTTTILPTSSLRATRERISNSLFRAGSKFRPLRHCIDVCNAMRRGEHRNAAHGVGKLMQRLTSTIRHMTAAMAVSSVLSACGGGSGMSAASVTYVPPPAPFSGGQICPLPGIDGLAVCMIYKDHMQDLDAILSGKVKLPPREVLSGMNPLTYASWGPWSGNSDVMAAPTGTLTAPDAIPHTGVANYSGYASGTWGSTSSPVPYQGTADVQVDFSSGQFNAFISDQFLFHTFGGSVTGNTYRADPQPDASSSFSGAFYGSGAKETAGTFQWTSVNDGFFPSAVVRGTFGAKLCPAGTASC